MLPDIIAEACLFTIIICVIVLIWLLNYLQRDAPKAVQSTGSSDQAPHASSSASSSASTSMDETQRKQQETHEFKISLQHAILSFDSSKRPKNESADWKPCHAVAGWSDYTQDEKSGLITTTPNKNFDCKQAAKVSTGAPTSDLQVHWEDGTASSVTIRKRLKKKQIIRITLFAAKYHVEKTLNPEPTKLCYFDEKDNKNKEIKLGTPFLVDLSVSRLFDFENVRMP
jgi:hypothetical protein